MASSGNFVETRREEREQSIMREIRHPSIYILKCFGFIYS
jgi:hypothetical protein